ncbi:DUF4855 domain-containing protein [Anaerorudis cellulosivorans]|uniref:DUF4855 domain-containing protein n=1 Tax=Anaerorudis cellulosivorans TaxID=3397862 RepID=UPI00221E41ED|nr:DUF4855 domain-containing protein [Seramator thermalis]MCW1734760.1 DUF4855 domain-containing protein [Seramator thermalis]
MEKDKITMAFFITTIIFFSICCKPNEITTKNENENHQTRENDSIFQWEKERKGLLNYNDMVLLYTGGAHRSYSWDINHISPYVTYVDENEKEHWLFDSFLFLEIHNGNGKSFATGYTSTPANQLDWKYLVDYFFQSKYTIGALDKAIGSAIERIGNPPNKRKIIIGLPEPIKNQKDWGSVENGILLDFSSDDDRIKACQWYIDYVRIKFNEMKYKNLDLAGFYWIAEEATNTRSIIKKIGTYLNDLKYTFNWIPYFKSDGYLEWKTLGFNYAYLQPNYFFNESVPTSRLDEACRLALDYDMDMEMECDERALVSSKNWGYRLRDYMDAFKKHGIWSSKRLAYYQGGTALYNLSKSVNEEDKKLYHDFCKFIIERPTK